MRNREQKIAIGAICFFLVIAMALMIATIALFYQIDSQEKEFENRRIAYEEAAAEREAARQAEIEAVKAEIHMETLARKAAEAETQNAVMAKEAAETKAQEEADARKKAEDKAEAETEARKMAESKAQAAEEAKEAAEEREQAATTAWQEAEAKVQAAEEAQKNAETRAKAAEDFQKKAETTTESIVKTVEEAKTTVPKNNLKEEVNNVTVTSEEGMLLQNFLDNNGLSLEDFVVTLTRVVYAEARGESWNGKVGVAEVYLNWIQSDRFHYVSEFENGYARITLEEYYSVKWSEKTEDREALQECERAVRAAIAGESPVEQLLGGVKPYYFYLPELSDPANVYVLERATYQIWVGNQLYTGLEGVDWTLKTQYQYQP